MNKIPILLPILLLFFIGFAQDDNKTQMDIYGKIMTDAGYNFNQINPLYFDVMRPSQLPSYKNEFGTDGNTYFGVRQSSMGFRTSTDTKYGELKTRFDFDLFGVGPNAGQTAFHFTFAWMEIGKLGIGQNWNLFCDFDGFPNTIEYWGPSGMALCRNVQIRYTPLSGKNRLAIAIERPGATYNGGVYQGFIETQNLTPKYKYPDLSAEFRITRKWGYAELAGIVRKIQWVDLNAHPYNLSGNAVGWGLNFSSNLKLGSKDVFIGQVVHGEGIGNYMDDGPTDISIQNNFGNPNAPIKGVALPVSGFTTYLNHEWKKNLTSTIGYSAVYIQNTNGDSANTIKKGQYASTNLLYSPLPNFMTGVELIWIRRDNYSDGWNSSATKIQFSCRYSFAQSIGKNK